MPETSKFGQFLKARRAHLGVSLRRFCRAHGLDPSNWSKLERGLLPPPQAEKLHEYGRFLQLEKGTDEWYEFCDLAAAEAGRLPSDLQDGELVSKLPVFFRTLRDSAKDGGRDTEELLEELKRKIRDA